MNRITLDSHDTAHDRRHQAEAIGRLLSLSRVLVGVLRVHRDPTIWEAARALAAAADAVEMARAPAGGATRARAQLDRYADDSGDEAQA